MARCRKHNWYVYVFEPGKEVVASTVSPVVRCADCGKQGNKIVAVGSFTLRDGLFDWTPDWNIGE